MFLVTMVAVMIVTVLWAAGYFITSIYSASSVSKDTLVGVQGMPMQGTTTAGGK